MKVVFTDEALRDIDDISGWLSVHYPGLGAAVARTFVDHPSVTKISRHPGYVCSSQGSRAA